MQDIYFINSKALTQELMTNNISDYVALKHVIASAVIFGASFEIAINCTPSETSLLSDLIYFLVMGAINTFGLIWIFQVNQKNDNQEFFKRVSALSLPVTMQVIIPTALFLIIVGISDISVTLPLYLIVPAVATLVFYALMGKCLRSQVNAE